MHYKLIDTFNNYSQCQCLIHFLTLSLSSTLLNTLSLSQLSLSLSRLETFD